MPVKVRYIGASQYQAWQVRHCIHLAERYSWSKMVSNAQAAPWKLGPKEVAQVRTILEGGL